MVLLGESLVLSAFVIGIVSAASLPLGAMTSFVWKPDQRVIAALMAFGAGSLLAALTIDLVGSALEHGHFTTLAVGSTIGGLLFIFLDNVVNNYGGYRRKFSTAWHHRNLTNRNRLETTLSRLGRTEMFSDLAPEDIDFLSHSLQSRFYAKGSVIYTKGDAANELFIIQEGKVKLDIFTKTKIFNPNDVFGRAALFTGSIHVFKAEAMEDCWLSVITKESLEHLLSISKNYRNHLKEWLLSEEIDHYLDHYQHFSADAIAAWRKELIESFDEECILPDITQIDRREEAFFEIAPALNRVAWLEELDEEEIAALSSHLVYKEYQQEEYLFTQGEPAQYLYIIHAGEIILSDEFDKNRQHTQIRGDGIGGRAFVCGLRHTISAKAAMNAKVWTLNRESFARLLKTHPNFRRRLSYYLNEPMLNAYLQERYRLNQGKILHWIDVADKRVKTGELPPSLLEMGIESTKPHGASLAIWLGIMLDGIPESLVIGANMIHSSISLSLIAGLFLSNYPEALSSSRGMREEHFSKWKIFWMWFSIMVFTGIGASLGYLFMQSAQPHWFAFLEGLAAGAMLTMIAQTMLPEAYTKGGSIIGFATLMGFLITISLKGLEH
jgi:CRP-like cAMP-binding protein/zinc transporter ZupT